jgi:hypothetical protein
MHESIFAYFGTIVLFTLTEPYSLNYSLRQYASLLRHPRSYFWDWLHEKEALDDLFGRTGFSAVFLNSPTPWRYSLLSYIQL